MTDIKIHILKELFDRPFGGGNQFLKALKKSLITKGIYEEIPEKADVYLFNSHQNIKKLLRLKLKHQNKLIIHRIDGPLYDVRGQNLEIDYEIYELNNLIADGTVFQSEWSKRKNCLLNFKKTTLQMVIMNASDGEIFFPNLEKRFNLEKKEKIRLVASSWSPNYNKGFDLYKFLDENLDFNHYSMKFIGNSPILFKNIEMIKPVKSNDLANILRESDIYITGSKNDPCSNSLIEALSCGLPCVALNDGGHPEIIKEGGETFNTFDDCLKKILLVENNYEHYKNNIQIPNIESISDLYIKFLQKILSLRSSKKYKGKRLRKIDYYKFRLKYNLFGNGMKQIINKSYRIISTILIRVLNKSKKKIFKYFLLMRLISSQKTKKL